MHERVVPAAQGPTAMSSGSVDPTPTIARRATMVPSAWIAITASGLPESLWPQYTPAWSRLAASPDSSGSPRGTCPTSRAVAAYRAHGDGGAAARVTGAIRIPASIAARPRIAPTLPEGSRARQSVIAQWVLPRLPPVVRGRMAETRGRRGRVLLVMLLLGALATLGAIVALHVTMRAH